VKFDLNSEPQHHNTHWNFSNDSMFDLNKICFWNFNLGTPQESKLSNWKCNWESWELHSCTHTYLSLIQDSMFEPCHTLALLPTYFHYFAPSSLASSRVGSQHPNLAQAQCSFGISSSLVGFWVKIFNKNFWVYKLWIQWMVIPFMGE
jgi:hypothetical protein